MPSGLLLSEGGPEAIRRPTFAGGEPVALIHCWGCGRPLSDQAVFCPHCEAPRAVQVNCWECGQLIAAHRGPCPHCGAPSAMPAAPTAVPSPMAAHVPQVLCPR